MTFDHGRYLTLTSDIERYLGYLKGNELVQEYAKNQAVEAEGWAMGQGEDGALYTMNVDYQSTPSEGEFVCHFTGVQFWVPFQPFGRPAGGWEEEMGNVLAAGAKQSWQNGNAWASGLGGYLRTICDSFVQADPAKFASTSVDLKNSIPPGLVMADFASSSSRDFGSTLVHWQGGARDAFVTFYEHVPAKADLYAVVTSRIGDVTEMVGALVAAAQEGLLDFLDNVKSMLHDQLVMWASQGSQPSSYSASDAGWVVDLLGVAGDIIEIIPVVDKFAEIPGDIVTAAEAAGDLVKAGTIINGYLDFDPSERKHPVDFSAQSAEQLYDKLTTVLYDDLRDKFKQAMLKIDSTLSGPLMVAVASCQSDGDWFTRSVPGIRNDTWGSDDDN